MNWPSSPYAPEVDYQATTRPAWHTTGFFFFVPTDGVARWGQIVIALPLAGGKDSMLQAEGRDTPLVRRTSDRLASAVRRGVAVRPGSKPPGEKHGAGRSRAKPSFNAHSYAPMTHLRYEYDCLLNRCPATTAFTFFRALARARMPCAVGIVDSQADRCNNPSSTRKSADLKR
jgi:hypothetical protein